jgi:hypothetical protein
VALGACGAAGIAHLLDEDVGAAGAGLAHLLAPAVAPEGALAGVSGTEAARNGGAARLETLGVGAGAAGG